MACGCRRRSNDFYGTQRHKDTKDDDYDDDYDFLSFVLRLSFFVPIIFWSGFALEIEFKIKQIIVGASVNKNFKDNFKRSAQKKVIVMVIVIVKKLANVQVFLYLCRERNEEF